MIPRRNVLIFHSGALGDFLLTWPLVLALGRVLPQSRIFCITHRQKGQLAEKVLRVESADVEGGWHHLFSRSPSLPQSAAKLLAGAQWIFQFVAGADSTWTRNVSRLAPDAPVITLSQAPPGDFRGHLSEYLVTQLQAWPIWEQAVGQILHSISDRGIARFQAGQTTVLHPGGGSPHKCWPGFLPLARRLTEAGQRPRIVLGEVELDRWTTRQIDDLAEVGDVCRSSDLAGLLAALSGAGVFVGNDSGPGHLAGIMGIPTISLFGPTEPARWHPLGPRVTILRREPIQAIEVDEVVKAIQAASHAFSGTHG